MNARMLAILFMGALIGGRHPAGPGLPALTEPEVRSWRGELEPLFDQPYEEIVARLGPPASIGPRGRMIYDATATQRSLSLGFRRGLVDSIQVLPRYAENMPIQEIVDRPETYYRCYGRSESASDYMAVWSRDGKVMAQYQARGRNLRLYRVIFLNDALGKAIATGPSPCRGTPESAELRGTMSRPNPPGPTSHPDDPPVRMEDFGEGIPA